MRMMHLLRMSRWARNPPSEGRVKLVFGIVAVALVLAGIEYMGWWPQWATAERIPRKF